MKKHMVTIVVSVGVVGLLAMMSAGSAATASTSAAEPTRFDVDGEHSSVLFGVQHLDLSHVYGRFNEISGKFLLDGGSLDELSIYMKIDAGSVDTNSKKRDQHLKSQDFFNSKQFRDIIFKSTTFKMLEPNKYEVTGDLTLHGETKPVTAVVVHTGTGDKGERMGNRSGFETAFTIKRSDFGMNYMVGSGLGDEVKVIVSIEGHRTQPAA
jgi:polyisoprenoid-binding protein YceI